MDGIDMTDNGKVEFRGIDAAGHISDVASYEVPNIADVAVEQIDDFNGDSRDDLRIRTEFGDIGVQLIQGAEALEWKYYGSGCGEWETQLAPI